MSEFSAADQARHYSIIGNAISDCIAVLVKNTSENFNKLTARGLTPEQIEQDPSFDEEIRRSRKAMLNILSTAIEQLGLTDPIQIIEIAGLFKRAVNSYANSICHQVDHAVVRQLTTRPWEN